MATFGYLRAREISSLLQNHFFQNSKKIGVSISEKLVEAGLYACIGPKSQLVTTVNRPMG